MDHLGWSILLLSLLLLIAIFTLTNVFANMIEDAVDAEVERRKKYEVEQSHIH